MAALTFDEFLPGGTTPGGEQVGADGRPRVTVSGPQALDFSEFAPDNKASGSLNGVSENAVSQVADIGKSAISGLDKGMASIAGLPGDIPAWMVAGAAWLRAQKTGKTYEEAAAELDKNPLIGRQSILDFQKRWGSDQYHDNSGLKHKPETPAGQVVHTVGEFLPGSVIGPGGMVRNAISYGVVPALASEAAGYATKGTKAEPFARAGAAIAGGIGGAWAGRRGSAGTAISDAAAGATPQQLDAAEQLFQQAQQMGAPITRAEAVQHVTNSATNLGNLQRVVEGSGEMRPFFAERPQQVEQATRQQLDQSFGAPSPQPSNIGPQLGEAAGGVVTDVTQAINRQTRPLYQAAETQRVGPQVHAALMGDELYARTLQEIRDNPALNRTIAHLPDDSVGVVDLVQRRLREQADNAAIPGQANTSNLASANYGDARTAPLAAADTVTGSAPGVAGTYETARNVQAQLRGQYLEPLMAGPIGKLAARDPTTKRAIEVLFPSNPLPNSQQEIGQAVTALAARNPAAARQVVRAHVESVFNESTQRLQSGANEFGGAGFAAVLRGNPQQAANLEAAVTALRGGQAYQGFDNFLQVLEAMGTRQRIGSQTAFNQAMQKQLSQGGTGGQAVRVAATGGFGWPRHVMDTVERWRLGRNVGQIADVLTNPQSAALFRQLATTPPTSQKAAALTARLVYLGASGKDSARQK